MKKRRALCLMLVWLISVPLCGAWAGEVNQDGFKVFDLGTIKRDLPLYRAKETPLELIDLAEVADLIRQTSEQIDSFSKMNFDSMMSSGLFDVKINGISLQQPNIQNGKLMGNVFTLISAAVGKKLQNAEDDFTKPDKREGILYIGADGMLKQQINERETSRLDAYRFLDLGLDGESRNFVYEIEICDSLKAEIFIFKLAGRFGDIQENARPRPQKPVTIEPENPSIPSEQDSPVIIDGEAVTDPSAWIVEGDPAAGTD